jgi:hypothetical protein
METIYADTWIDLTVKMTGYYHDHCRHYYSGRTDNVPEKYKELITEDKEFVFIYEEYKPLNYDTKIQSSEN